MVNNEYLMQENSTLSLGGKDFVVAYNVKALIKLEQLFGVPFTDIGQKLERPTVQDVLKYVYCGLIQYQPGLKLEELEELVEIEDLQTVVEVCTKALEVSLSKKK